MTVPLSGAMEPPAELAALCHAFGLEAIYIFGSRAVEVADACYRSAELGGASVDVASRVDLNNAIEAEVKAKVE